jgi:hypothetical protein
MIHLFLSQNAPECLVCHVRTHVDKLKCCTPHLVFKVLNLRHFNAIKIPTLLLLIAMLGSCTVISQPIAAASSDVLLWVNPSTQAVGEGETFNVSIIVDNLPSPNGAVGFELTLKWDPAILTGISVTDVLFHSIAPPDNIWKLKAAVDNVEGNAWYAYTFQDLFLARDDGYAPISGNHTLAIVTLKGLNSGWSTFSFARIVVGGYDYDNALTTLIPSSGLGANVVVGNPPPVITIVSPQNRTYNTNAFNLTVDVSKPLSWIAYSLDGGTNVAITANMTVLQVPQGQHNIVVSANDTTGQTGSSEKVYFYVDTTLPTALYATTPTTPQAELIHGNFRWKLFFNASASSDGGSGIAGYFWNFGDGTNASGVAVAHEYKEPGTYSLTLTVTDNAGNSATKSETLNISPASQSLEIPWVLIGAIIIPVAWVPALWYYLIRMRRKKKKA